MCNDLHPTQIIYYEPNDPLGFEVQVTIYGQNRRGILDDAIFMKYKIINKGNNTIDKMFLGIAPGLGGLYLPLFPSYEFNAKMGFDTTLNLQYYYDRNYDTGYEVKPSFGLKLVQGPVIKSVQSDSAFVENSWIDGFKNLSSYSFTTFQVILSPSLFPDSNLTHQQELYNQMNGFWKNGSPIINPVTNEPTRYLFTGDPVSNTGWNHIQGWQPGVGQAGAQGLNLMSIGPFAFAPQDTQVIVIAGLAAQGTDNLNSVTELKRKARIIQKAYNLNFKLTPPPPNPKVTVKSRGR